MDYSENKGMENALLRFFETKYGVRTRNYMIVERIERIPDELIEQYSLLLKRKNVRNLRIESSDEGFKLIHYVDISVLSERDSSFWNDRRDILESYMDSHDEYQPVIKTTPWGSPDWSDKEVISELKQLTCYYSYFCFEKKFLDVVSRLISEKYHYTPDVLDASGIPNFMYFALKMDSFAMKQHEQTEDWSSAWAFLTYSYIPVIQIDDRRGKIFVEKSAEYLSDFSKYNQGMRIDIGHIARSSWEANIARIFVRLGIAYEYEREYFSVENLQYLPDFFLPNNIIVEVKGFWDDASRKKVAALEKAYPEYTILPLDADMYETLRRKYADEIPEWEDNAPTKRMICKVSVVGMKFCASEETLQSLEVGDELDLEREPENRFDSNAVLVKTKDNSPIGHFCADWAAVFAPKMDVGMTYHTEILDIQIGVIHVTVQRSNPDEELVYDIFT